MLCSLVKPSVYEIQTEHKLPTRVLPMDSECKYQWIFISVKLLILIVKKLKGKLS